MIDYHIIEPEVAGGWGEDTQFTRTPGRPVVVHKLHYEFDGWLGDELLESTPCYIASERLAKEIEQAKMTGLSFGEVKVTKSGQFRDLYPDRVLPRFVWLKVEGVPGRDDFGMTSALLLVVSTRALTVLENVQITHALVRPFES